MNTFFADYTKNISKGGTFIKTERPLPVGTEFVFKLAVPWKEEAFHLSGAVVWTNSAECSQRPEEPSLGMGIRFIFTDPQLKSEFEGDVEQMMIDSLGPLLHKQLLGR